MAKLDSSRWLGMGLEMLGEEEGKGRIESREQMF